MVNFTRKPRYGYEDLLEIIRLLRSPEGCPWDRVQTHASIRRGLLEESYEAAEAIDLDSASMLREISQVLGEDFMFDTPETPAKVTAGSMGTGVFSAAHAPALSISSMSILFIVIPPCQLWPVNRP